MSHLIGGCVLLLVILNATLTLGYEAQFFYSPVFDRCQCLDASMQADGLSSHGSVCAYVPDTQKIYGCPASDETCWSWASSCEHANGIAGSDQVQCRAGTTNWCCDSDETCTTTEGQINVCISIFASPNSGVSVKNANHAAAIVLGVTSITATVQTADPIPFSTLSYGQNNIVFTNTVTSIATTTATTGTSQSSAIATSGDNAASTEGPRSTSSISLSPSSSLVEGITEPQSSSSPSSTPSPSSASSSQPSKSISAGAIAGIVIGVVAVLAIIVVGALFLRNQRRSHMSAAPPYSNPPQMAQMGFNPGSQPGELADTPAPVYQPYRAYHPTNGFYGKPVQPPMLVTIATKHRSTHELPT